MKTAQERLSESYCRPMTEDETERLMDASRSCGFSWNVWNHKGKWLYFADGDEFNLSGELDGRTEITVSHFIDLLKDSIVPWRLVNDVFNTVGEIVHTLELRPVIDGETVVRKITVITDTEKVYLNDGPTNVTTYTDLLTLIRLIG
jgi:hypothetical protein